MKTKLFLISATFLLLIFGCKTQQKVESTTQADITKKPIEKEKTLDYQLQDLTNQIVTSLSQTQKTKIAVIEFSNLQGQITGFGRYLAEELITRLYRTGKFEVIERQMLNKVIREHQLTLSGLIDETSAKELGRILGVDAIASGSVTDLGNSVKVNARLISTETGKIFSVASVKIIKNDVIRKLMGQAITAYTTFETEPGDPNETEPVSLKPPKIPPLNMIVNQGEHTFELKTCEMKGETVTFSFVVTNNTRDDKELVIWFRNTKIFDQTGNEYFLYYCKIANSKSRESSNGWGGSSRMGKMLVAGVPTPMTIVFKKVFPEANQISLLNIAAGSIGPVKFRNIPITHTE